MSCTETFGFENISQGQIVIHDWDESEGDILNLAELDLSITNFDMNSDGLLNQYDVAQGATFDISNGNFIIENPTSSPDNTIGTIILKDTTTVSNDQVIFSIADQENNASLEELPSNLSDEFLLI